MPAADASPVKSLQVLLAAPSESCSGVFGVLVVVAVAVQTSGSDYQ